MEGLPKKEKNWVVYAKNGAKILALVLFANALSDNNDKKTEIVNASANWQTEEPADVDSAINHVTHPPFYTYPFPGKINPENKPTVGAESEKIEIEN